MTQSCDRPRDIDPRQWIICWQMPNGFKGRGQEPLLLMLADAWVERLKSEHPEMHHWCEPR